MKTADGSDLKGQISMLSIRKVISRRNDFDDACFRCDLEFRLLSWFALSFPCHPAKFRELLRYDARCAVIAKTAQ
jgi:hypothetical protein